MLKTIWPAAVAQWYNTRLAIPRLRVWVQPPPLAPREKIGRNSLKLKNAKNAKTHKNAQKRTKMHKTHKNAKSDRFDRPRKWDLKMLKVPHSNRNSTWFRKPSAFNETVFGRFNKIYRFVRIVKKQTLCLYLSFIACDIVACNFVVLNVVTCRFSADSIKFTNL